MSNKKRKPKKRGRAGARAGPVMTAQQQARYQQALEAQQAGQLGVAEQAYRALLAEKVKSPQLVYRLGLVCAHTGRYQEAQALWRQALSEEPGFLDAALSLASSYALTGQPERAEARYRRIILDHPGCVPARYLLANLLKARGEFAQAADHYRQIMAMQPDYTQAHFTYSGIHRYRDRDDPHIASMLALYASAGLQDANRIHLAFALAKAFEDLGDYPRAFGYLRAGNDLRHAASNYTIEGDRNLILNIIRTFSREALAGLRVDAPLSDKPIFIVGMPRSGTSLVEKIIASHPDVHGAGELDYLSSLGAELFMKASNYAGFTPLDSYPPASFRTLGEGYLEKIGRLAPQARRVTDKMPFNMMMIGLIRAALPNAKIIHCVRDARDTCLSIYKQNFATDKYRFAYKLETIGQFHKLYVEMMKHWHAVMPGAIHDLSYEALTRNPEPEIRKLLAACGLDWQDACLNFQKTPGLVHTASFFQVRQPMYTSSVGLWQNYRDFLQPLLAVLAEAG